MKEKYVEVPVGKWVRKKNWKSSHFRKPKDKETIRKVAVIDDKRLEELLEPHIDLQEPNFDYPLWEQNLEKEIQGFYDK